MNAKMIGERLLKLRGQKTREQVAKDVQISQSALAMYELGNRIPRDEVKIRLANYYQKTVQSIFFN